MPLFLGFLQISTTAFSGQGWGGGGVGGVVLLFCSGFSYLCFPWDICRDCGLKIIPGSESPFLIYGARFSWTSLSSVLTFKDPWDTVGLRPP